MELARDRMLGRGHVRGGVLAGHPLAALVAGGVPVIVVVKYGRVVDLAQALKCRRCEGGGRERFVPGICPRCSGSGERADGWNYQANGLALRVGDVVEVPRTPRSSGTGPQEATVVAVGVETERMPYSRVLRIIEPGAGQ